MTAITTSAVDWVIAVPLLAVAAAALIGVLTDNRRPRP